MTPLQRAQWVEELHKALPVGPLEILNPDDDDRWALMDEDGMPVVILEEGGERFCRFLHGAIEHMPALAADVVALTDLLRDAFPMFSHVPLLRDRAIALGLVERKEQEP